MNCVVLSDSCLRTFEFSLINRLVSSLVTCWAIYGLDAVKETLKPVIAFVLSVVTRGGITHGILSGLWHGGAVYGLTGAAGAIIRSRKDNKL